jgi:hypothetical protein
MRGLQTATLISTKRSNFVELMFADWEFTAIIFLPVLAVGLLYLNRTDSFEWKSAVTAFLRSQRIPEGHDDILLALVRNKMLFASIEPTIMGCILACFQLSLKFDNREFIFLCCLSLLLVYYFYAKALASEVGWAAASMQRLDADWIEQRWWSKGEKSAPKFSNYTRDQIITAVLAASYLLVVGLACAVVYGSWLAETEREHREQAAIVGCNSSATTTCQRPLNGARASR